MARLKRAGEVFGRVLLFAASPVIVLFYLVLLPVALGIGAIKLIYWGYKLQKEKRDERN